MNKIKPKVVVLVVAYNEEKNIKEFLSTVLAQKEVGYILDRIWVISDGSTDNTVEIAKSFKSPKIFVQNYKARNGKSIRLNNFYQETNCDILVQSDADVIYSHPYVIFDLITPLRSPCIGLTGGNPIPKRGNTFTERAVNYTVSAYLPYRTKIKNGHNIFSADGRLLALKKTLYKKIEIPSDMIANDAFAYFCCKKEGYEYRHVESAIVHFRSPQNIFDQIRQNTRFLAAATRMKKYFPSAVVKSEYHIPKAIELKTKLIQFINHPIECIYIFAVNVYCRLRAMYLESKLNAIWDMAYSTKKL